MTAPEAAENDEALVVQYVLEELPPELRHAFDTRLLVEPELALKVRARRKELARLAETLATVEPGNCTWRRFEGALERKPVPARPALQPGGGAAGDSCPERNR
ncbi:MAG: hypothetical protein AB7F36_16425 [Reyranellaceae bacterium]